jgi:7,8-dihydroneopterin aldolase/epimerase/oxygenase
VSTPVLDGEGRPLDQVVLRGLSVRGRHGVLDAERELGQTFVLDVVLHLDTRAAAAGDDLTRTVHYGVLAEQVAAVVAGEPVALVETLAQRVADVALGPEPVVAVDVTVHKPQAPVTVPFADVEVRIRRWRQ